MLAIYHVSSVSEDGQDTVTPSAYASSDLISRNQYYYRKYSPSESVTSVVST